MIANTDNILTELMDLYDHGAPRGISTGWYNLDNYYTVVKGQTTIISGVPSHGKSEFLDAILMNLAEANNWRFVVYSPENYPLYQHYQKLIEKRVRKPLWGEYRMSAEEMLSAIPFINDHFIFIDGAREDTGLNTIFKDFATQKNIDGVILDPWNEIEVDRPKSMNETDYIGFCLKRCRRFARNNNIAFWIVAHPMKLRREKNGDYLVPTPYDTSGSAHWYNKPDNYLTVWRTDLWVEIHIQKVKFKYYGKKGMIKLMYKANSGTYEVYNEHDNYGPYF